MLEPSWTTVNDAADRLGYSRRHVFRLIADYDVDTARQRVPGSTRWMTTVHLEGLRDAIRHARNGSSAGTMSHMSH